MLRGYCNADNGASDHSAKVGESSDAAWLL